MTLWRPRAVAPARRLAIRPRLLSLEDRSLPSTTLGSDPPATPPAAPLVAFGADVGYAPLVQVYDSADGSLKYSFLAYDANYRGGVRVAVGDVSGDGIDDIVTAPGPGVAPVVKVFDGVSGQQVAGFLAYDNFLGGAYVAVGDVNGDGFGDVITGAGAGGGPHVKAFNGAWAVPPIGLPVVPIVPPPVLVVDPPPPVVAPVSTDPATGTDTLPPVVDPPVVDPPVVEPPVVVSPPEVTIPVMPPPLDTTTQVLQSFMAYDVIFSGGVSVSAGDVNGDGKDDIVTGAGRGGGPHVMVFNGAAMAQPLLSFMAYASTYTGGVYVTAGDVDGDGKAEVVAGSGGRGLMQTRLFEDDGRLLRTFDVAGQNSPLSVHVGMVDYDHDGRADLLTSAGNQIQVRNPTNNAVKGVFAPSDPAFLGGTFVG